MFDRFKAEEKVFKSALPEQETKSISVKKFVEEFKEGTRVKPAFYADLMETVTDAR